MALLVNLFLLFIYHILFYYSCYHACGYYAGVGGEGQEREMGEESGGIEHEKGQKEREKRRGAMGKSQR